MLPDSPAADLVLMQHACARLGAALFPYRRGLPSAELAAMAAATGAEWRWCPDSGRLERTPVVAREVGFSGGTLALLVKTSGSSGTPKVAMLTAGNLLTSAWYANRQFGLAPGDTWLACLRLSHVGGLSISYRCALAGATLLLHDGFDVAAVARDLTERAVSHLSVVPPMLARLLDLGLSPPPGLRVLMVGGQALGPVLTQRALDAGWPLHLSYGMTETASHVASTERLAGRVADPACAGHLLDCVETNLTVRGGPPARLRLRGPVVMAGYANPTRRSGDGLDDGWFEAADLACRGADGQLRVLGRADDVLVIGGTNVSRQRVEGVLQSAPRIGDLVVVGLADPVWGQRLAVVHTGDLAPRELADWCRSRLSGPERPRLQLRLPRLPLLDSGKFDRVRIAALARRFGHDLPQVATR